VRTVSSPLLGHEAAVFVDHETQRDDDGGDHDDHAKAVRDGIEGERVLLGVCVCCGSAREKEGKREM